jgi:hypothetical protein
MGWLHTGYPRGNLDCYRRKWRGNKKRKRKKKHQTEKNKEYEENNGEVFSPG